MLNLLQAPVKITNAISQTFCVESIHGSRSNLTPCAFLSDMFCKKNFCKKNFEVKIPFLYNIGENHYVLQILKNTFQRIFTEYIWQLFLFFCISCHTGRKYEILIQFWLVVDSLKMDKNINFLQYANHIF